MRGDKLRQERLGLVDYPLSFCIGERITTCRFLCRAAALRTKRHKVTRNMNTPDDITKSCFDTLLAATAADNLEQFVSVGDENFANGMRREPERLHCVSRWLTPRMQKGFTPTFLGELRERGYIVRSLKKAV
jgi:hypothetical protein